MRFTATCLAGAIVCSAPAAWAQIATSQETPIVYVGLFSVSQKGGRGHTALTAEKAGQDISGMLSISPCGGGSAGTARVPISAFATDVWLLTGKTLEMNDQQTSIQLEWRRLRAGGLDETSAQESTTLTLKRGERRTLETLSFPPSGSCDASTSSLDVVFGTRQEISGSSQSDRAHGSAGGGVGVGVGAGSHKKTGNAAPTFTTLGLTADLWLVRTRPGRPDETLHVTETVMPIPRPFSFAPMTIESPGGTLNVRVEGTLESGRTADGERRLHFTATRAVAAVTSARPARSSEPVVEGSTKTTIAFPGPDEVLSFELPPLRTTDGATLPDRLSIRLRIASPAKE
jgi:hypothetical protein